MIKKTIKTAILCMLAVSTSACSALPDYFSEKYQDIIGSRLDDGSVRAAVIYSGGEKEWKAAMSNLEQSMLANLEAEAIDVEEDDFDLEDYDVVYPDSSIISSPDSEGLKRKLKEYAEGGGALFLDNEFHGFFDKGFLGAREFVKLEKPPEDMKFPEVEADISEVQGIIEDFSGLYREYVNYGELSRLDYGYGMIPDTAAVLARQDGVAIYTLNRVKEGYVFFTNPMLPNAFSINGFGLEKTDPEQAYFANTTASANAIIRSKFAAYIAKKKRGYSVERVMGSFGSPAIAWQLHYEEITGIENDSAILFGDLCKQYQQAPSYTLVRNTYKWFERSESVGYLLGKADGLGLKYDRDSYEGAYSYGRHIVSDGGWLSLERTEDTISYFEDSAEYDKRSYPSAGDWNRDGLMDLVSGSSDGYFYSFRGMESDKGSNYTVDSGQRLKAPSGEEISVPSYSAPVMVDIDRDGTEDIVSGCGDGEIYWFKGAKDFTFESKGILIGTGLGASQSNPAAGDLNGDGVVDLVVGSKQGKLLYYRGRLENGAPSFDPAGYIKTGNGEFDLGLWVAPQIVDIDGDGRQDLAVGTFEGYIAKLINDGNGQVFRDSGYFEGSEKNYKGNRRLKFGNNCVPHFYDMNKDGTLDLIAGQLEYGLAVPIDSPYFKHRKELEQQIDYAEANGFYMGVHFYSHKFASKELENDELELHRKALESYGIPWEGTGVNQHTWVVSGNSSIQTYAGQRKSGLLWNSGSLAPGSKALFQDSAENVMCMPFYMDQDRGEDMLLMNASTLLHADDGYADIAARYNIPVSIYYHCDLAYKDMDKEEEKVSQVAKFADKNGYSFMREDQMAKSIAAAYNSKVSIEKERDGFVLSASEKSRDLALYDERYQNSTGVKVSFSSRQDMESVSTDADVSYREGRDIYISLNKDVRIYTDGMKADVAKIKRVNIPADISYGDGGLKLEFLDRGMQQAEVYGRASTRSKGWKTTRKGESTVFTKYGEAGILEIGF